MSPDPAFERAALAFAGLARPNRVEDRLAALRAFIEWWHGPITAADAVPEPLLARLALPRPLAWWYRLAGGRAAIMSGQNHLFQPGESRFTVRQLRVKDGRLQFQMENQGCFFWSTLPEGDDPPVFGRESEHEPWRIDAGVTLAEHLVLNAVFEAVMCHAPISAFTCDLPDDKLARLAAEVPALPIGPWMWHGMRFYAGREVIMTTHELGEEDGRLCHFAVLGAKRDEAFAAIEPLLGDEWQRART